MRGSDIASAAFDADARVVVFTFFISLFIAAFAGVALGELDQIDRNGRYLTERIRAGWLERDGKVYSIRPADIQPHPSP